MKIQVPTNSETSSEPSPKNSSNRDYHDVQESLETDSIPDWTDYFEDLYSKSDITFAHSTLQANTFSNMDTNMEKPNNASSDSEKLSRLVVALEQAPPEIQAYVKAALDGQSSQLPNTPSIPSNTPAVQSSQTMINNAKFEKWDGELHSWSPHFHFLKIQCKVYLPLLITEEAICMKIYGSIPEPQRQKIRGYWMKYGRQEVYNYKELLEECNNKFFDKVRAEKAEKRLHAMRQGEAQFFRVFLQEWELQLEYPGDCVWPDSFKINQLRQATSDKLTDKTDVLELPRNNYQEWVDIIARVAAKIESRENFYNKGEARVTQYVNRKGIESSHYCPNL